MSEDPKQDTAPKAKTEGRIDFDAMYMAAAEAIEAGVWMQIAEIMLTSNASPELVEAVVDVASYSALKEYGIDGLRDEKNEIITGMDPDCWLQIWRAILHHGVDEAGMSMCLLDVRKCYALCLAMTVDKDRRELSA